MESLKEKPYCRATGITPPLAPTSASDDETLLDGHMRLYAFYTLGLEGGGYTVSASQQITAYKENEAQSTTLQNQQLVKSQTDPTKLVPGDKVVQAFNVHDEGRILPHIVFNDPHVPWLRDAGQTPYAKLPIPGAPGTDSWAGRTKVPWMALLVFQPEDLTFNSTEADLLNLSGLDAWKKAIPDKPPADLSYTMNVSDFMRLNSRVRIETGLVPGSDDWKDMINSTEQTRAIFPTKDQVLKIFTSSPSGRNIPLVLQSSNSQV
ncbi:hypothetical protein F5883DRAFT_665560 [Diaporthe sp. PMI_573]|nr:hypothetical protein F5883DRAFT_665560 [Diaporthaceae sp. PMI_573]